jgi:hypothetical protein
MVIVFSHEFAGSQAFIYSGSGAWLLDRHTEALERIAYVSAYGLTAWLAE